MSAPREVCECGVLHVAMHGGHDPRCPVVAPAQEGDALARGLAALRETTFGSKARRRDYGALIDSEASGALHDHITALTARAEAAEREVREYHRLAAMLGTELGYDVLAEPNGDDHPDAVEGLRELLLKRAAVLDGLHDEVERLREAERRLRWLYENGYLGNAHAAHPPAMLKRATFEEQMDAVDGHIADDDEATARRRPAGEP